MTISTATISISVNNGTQHNDTQLKSQRCVSLYNINVVLSLSFVLSLCWRHVRPSVIMMSVILLPVAASESTAVRSFMAQDRYMAVSIGLLIKFFIRPICFFDRFDIASVMPTNWIVSDLRRVTKKLVQTTKTKINNTNW